MAYTTGVAQRRTNQTVVTTNFSGVQATLGTATNPGSSTAYGSAATSIAFEVTAGTSVSIRWGGALRFGSYTAAASNSCQWLLNVVYETGNGNSGTLWETAATDSTTTTGVAATDWLLDRTLTFTPTHTGTVRLFVQARVRVTATDTTIAIINTDAGAGFGSTAETIPVGEAATSVSYGLLRCGCTLTSLAMSGMTSASQGYFPETATATFVTSHAPGTADGTYTLSWRDATPTQFTTSSIAAGTSTSLAASKAVAPSASFPAANTAVNLSLTPASSGLSTANSGAALPWVHFVAVPSSPGTVTRTNDAAGNAVAVAFAGAFSADPRLQYHAHAQKTTNWPNSPFDPGSPAPYDTWGDDIYLFIISADLFYGWFAAHNMNSVGQNGITGSMKFTDPNVTDPTATGGGVYTTSLVTTTVGGNPVGYSRQSTPYQFTPAAPSGQYHWWCESATDGTNTWTRLNGYLVAVNGNTDASGGFAGFAEGINFVSAYRDNLYLACAASLATGTSTVTHSPKPGDPVIVGCRILKDAGGTGNFGPYHADTGTTPNVKVASFNQATGMLAFVIGSDSAGVAMSNDPVDTSVWTYTVASTATWAPNVYIAFFTAFVDGGSKLNQVQFDVMNPQVFLDAVDLALQGNLSFR